MLDVSSDTVAEGFFQRMGYLEIGRVPNYAINPIGHLRSQTFFYKSLAA
jgi:ribosomal protein S18 acetylase RimI-like enzyme